MSTSKVEEIWEKHYGRARARLAYPDENLVRLLAAVPAERRTAALDYGCGSGRHLRLLRDFQFDSIYGCDLSETSVRLCQASYPFAQVWQTASGPQGDPLPAGTLDAGTLDVGILWGVLHYNDAGARLQLLEALVRALRPDGQLIGTLRAVGETHLAHNADVKGLHAEIFDRSTAMALLGRFFDRVELGYMERAPVGELGARVCHWIFRCRHAR